MTLQSQHSALKTYVEERDSLIAIAARIVDSRAVAEELVQESWLRWDASTYPTDKAKPVFRSIVTNLARDWRRRRTREVSILENLVLTFDDPRDAERVLIARQEIRRLVSALEELDPRVVKAFRLHRVEGMTMTQIAKELGTVPSSIHGYIVKALSHITFRMME
ncbi:MAG: sigma-70 family RNA polymerase sigma factor [Pseudomonadota bacterium]